MPFGFGSAPSGLDTTSMQWTTESDLHLGGSGKHWRPEVLRGSGWLGSMSKLPKMKGPNADTKMAGLSVQGPRNGPQVVKTAI